MQSASTDPLSGAAALAVLDGVRELYVAQGKKIRRVDLVSGRPTDPELLELLLGRSGKLRAPALRTGSTLLVGYHSDFLAETLL